MPVLPLPWRRALLVATALFGLAGAASAGAPPKQPGAEGVEVKVTKQMIGAGQVSSGVTLPAPPPVTGSRANPVPAWSGSPLPYPVVIADRRNNRLIEIAPDNSVIWEYPSPDLKVYRGNDDVFFAQDGNTLVINEEDNYDVHFIDYAKRELAWSYGVPDQRGSAPGWLNYPDDAHLMDDGKLVLADIRNCRILFVDPENSETIDHWGEPGACRHDPPRTLGYPNGVTPLPGGDLLVTEITDTWISRITRQGKVVWSMRTPHEHYPSDAFPTQDGQVVVADFWKPGRVVIFDPRTKKITWEYFVKEGEGALDHPSLALELPTGDIIVNDDWRNRVVVISRQSKRIVWQYGHTDQPGHAPDYLFYPDGMDIDVFHDWRAALAK